MTGPLSLERLQAATRTACDRLLSELGPDGHWVGELSTSALSTATAVMALLQVDRAKGAADHAGAIRGGLVWLAEHQNEDGGWGDTVLSFSNISTTMLGYASFHAADRAGEFAAVRDRAKAYVERGGGVPAIVARYGKDRTFSVPILTHAALAGLVEWKQITPLPFELSCLPHQFYAAARLPVVSYALPALIAIGQVRFHFGKPWNPITRSLREMSRERSLRVLTRIQPENGGFLEAAPLTSFVTMSLAAMGLADHPVVVRGVDFLLKSIRPDGSWPIDTNLATWTTTLSVNALQDDLPQHVRSTVLPWLLGQQYQVVHPYTHAAPGAWAWTDQPGGVPDADDTPGAMLALVQLYSNQPLPDPVQDSLRRGVRWLLDLQNGDGGWPTFCRGWGLLPFDRSSADLTAHAIRALTTWMRHPSILQARSAVRELETLCREGEAAIRSGFRYLDKVQRKDGSWLPLWFGNQHAPDDENPVYGTSRVLKAYSETGMTQGIAYQDALRWLRSVQNPDGGWGGATGCPSSTEETSLALDALADDPESAVALERGAIWLVERVESGVWLQPSPIGFYFAKLWYFERLYPIIFAVGALRRLLRRKVVEMAAGRG
jgi:squalene-hopene/tetraprenyl-beta-curcumene cyclase